MTNNIGKSLKKFILVLMCSILVFSLFSCKSKYDYEDEIIAVKRFLIYQNVPDNLMINTLEKYEVSEKEIFYYVKWYEKDVDVNNEVYELLLVYNTQTTLINLRHFNDMDQGLYSAVKTKWDEVKGNPNRTFTAEEINSIKQKAIDIYNEEKSMKAK